MKRNTELSQYFTPMWAAELLVKRHFADLGPKDCVWEPSCGDGRFLMAIPREVDAFGTEIDPVMADRARVNSGREVITGSLVDCELLRRPTAIIGNPPFELALVMQLLERAYEEMDYDGRMGLLLPVYMFQTADTVMDMAKRFSITQELLPRNLFQGMQKPLLFATFIKERTRTLLDGFFLYDELSAVLKLSKQYRYLFVGNESSASLWGEVVEKALITLGGQATLKAIYLEIEGKQPTSNPFWKAQVRKVLREKFVVVGPAEYALHEHAGTGCAQIGLFAA